MNSEQGSQIGFAVIGYGRMGSRHVAILNENPEAKLCAIADTDEKCSSAKGILCFRSLDELLVSQVAREVEVVNITTPNGCHATLAIEALRAGKHVVVEKPLALNSADAGRIIQTATATGKYVFVVVQNRFAPPAIWLHELVHSGRLGNIYMVSVNAFWNRDERYYKQGGWHGKASQDGGVLFTQFSHFVDTLFWVFGVKGGIQARLRNFSHRQITDFDDSGIVTFDLPGGGIAQMIFTTSTWDRNLDSQITVIAENGSVRLKGQYLEIVDYCHVKDLTGLLPPVGMGPADANHRLFLQNVIDTLKGRTSPVADARDGWKVVDFIESIYRG